MHPQRLSSLATPSYTETGGESVYLSSCLPTRVGYEYGRFLGPLLELLCLELVSLLLGASYRD